jgi:hypothetical protein
MNSDANSAMRDAIGCFLLLVLGAFASMGAVRVVVFATTEPAGQEQGEWLRQFLIWVVAPSAGFALVAWLVWRFRVPGGWNRFDGKR